MVNRLKELENEREMLIKMREKRSKFLLEKTREAKLKKEISKLKYPRTHAALKDIKDKGRSSAKTLGLGIRRAVSAQLKIGADQRKKEMMGLKVKKRPKVLSVKKKKKTRGLNVKKRRKS